MKLVCHAAQCVLCPGNNALNVTHKHHGGTVVGEALREFNEGYHLEARDIITIGGQLEDVMRLTKRVPRYHISHSPQHFSLFVRRRFGIVLLVKTT